MAIVQQENKQKTYSTKHSVTEGSQTSAFPSVPSCCTVLAPRWKRSPSETGLPFPLRLHHRMLKDTSPKMNTRYINLHLKQ